MKRADELRRLPGGVLPLILFWFGGACIAVGLIVGVQAIAVPHLGGNLRAVWLSIPTWGMVAILLSLIARRDQSSVIRSLALIWLVAGLASALFYFWVASHA